MPEIALRDANTLMDKLIRERVPLHVHFRSPSGTEALVFGSVDSKGSDGTVVISTSGPALAADKGYFRFWIGGVDTSIWYGEKRELPIDMPHLADKFGESALVFEISEFDEWVAFFFTIPPLFLL